jgi:hypothetical protein
MCSPAKHSMKLKLKKFKGISDSIIKNDSSQFKFQQIVCNLWTKNHVQYAGELSLLRSDQSVFLVDTVVVSNAVKLSDLVHFVDIE